MFAKLRTYMDALNSNNKLLVGAGIAVVVVGSLWLMTREASAPSDLNGAETNGIVDTGPVPIDTKSVPSTTSDSESVYVSDQPAGESIAVASVSFTQSGWITVRDDRGWTLGAARFDEGVHSDVEVPLLRATTAGERYQVLLYIDDGDSEFDLDKEILVTRSDGSVAGATFSAQ